MEEESVSNCQKPEGKSYKLLATHRTYVIGTGVQGASWARPPMLMDGCCLSLPSWL
jgi:hypothetical protein